MVDACITLSSETLLTSIEYDASVLQLLISGLIHRFWTSSIHSKAVLVQAWAWHFELETLSVEDLIVIETGRGCSRRIDFGVARLLCAASTQPHCWEDTDPRPCIFAQALHAGEHMALVWHDLQDPPAVEGVAWGG